MIGANYFLGDALKRRALLVFAVTAAVLAGCAEAPPVSDQVQSYYDSHKSLQAASPAIKTLAFAAYGDSITNGNSPDFAAGKFGSLSWASYLGDGFTFAGGWAQGGVKSETMLQHATPIKADVLVLLAGANDYANSVPFDQTTANLDGIVAKTGVARVVLSAVPPRDATPDAATVFNQKLEQLATARKWQFIDPMAGVRNGDRYAPGMTADGVHPTEAAAKIIGQSLSAAIKGAHP
ncbi:SGNH/GDSL hydrolase family protein [Arthrobacter sp. NPDC080073]|uniref:SGNH/GDSL hydrolase family protein n=1 Tax=Arthrobacter sp. NPDC080073 TaxID=3155919 RepID=UPI0034251232